jgi:hypothetical protein
MRFALAIFLFCFATSTVQAGISGLDLLQEKPVEIAAGIKGTVAIFLSVKCACSNSHLSVVRKLVKDFPDFHFVVIHSNADESVSDSRKYFSAAELGIPVIQDENAKLADEFKALKTPHAYVLGLDGKILYRGGVTNSANGETANEQPLRAALEDVSASRPVKNPFTRVLGCVIAR